MLMGFVPVFFFFEVVLSNPFRSGPAISFFASGLSWPLRSAALVAPRTSSSRGLRFGILDELLGEVEISELDDCRQRISELAVSKKSIVLSMTSSTFLALSTTFAGRRQVGDIDELQLRDARR